MSKAVLISIRPKWCELIASGKKTIEVRKTAPKIETPFKCYIYCTKPSKAYQTICGCMVLNSDELYRHPRHGIRHGDSIELMVEDDYTADNFLNGKVIGEFTCDRIIEWHYIPDPDESADPGSMAYDVLTVDGEKTGLEYDDFEDYGKGAPLFGWHISDLVIYDKPKKMSDFRLYNTSAVIEHGLPMPTHEIKRPPQSFCYVEDLT